MTTPALVNSASNSRSAGGSPTSDTTTIPATTAGNCLVVAVTVSTSWPGNSPGGTPTIAGMTIGGIADNFTQVISKTNASELAQVWVDPNCAGGKTSLTMSGTVLNSISICIMEFSGITSVSPYLTGVSASGSSTTISTGSYTTTGPSLSVALLTSLGSNFSGSEPSGWTRTFNDLTYLAKHFYRIDGSGGTFGATMNHSGATNWTALAAALKPTGLYNAASVNSLAVASVGTINGLADAASFNGLT